MAKLTKGDGSLTKMIGDELEADPPPWDKLKDQSKEFVALAGSMSKYDPPKGSKESWTKMTADYTNTALKMEKAINAKNKDAALAAQQTLSSSCMACHREHRGMPGKFGPGGPRGPGAKGPG